MNSMLSPGKKNPIRSPDSAKIIDAITSVTIHGPVVMANSVRSNPGIIACSILACEEGMV